MSISDLVNLQEWTGLKARDEARDPGTLSAGDRFRGRFSARWLLVPFALFAVALVLAVPAYLLIRTAEAGGETLETLTATRTWATLGNTIGLAVSVTLASVAIAVPLAWLTSWTDLPGKRFWAVAVALPLVIPSYIAAYLYASLLSPRGPLQQALAPLGVERMPDILGFRGAFFLLTLISYPFVYLTVRAALQRMDPSLLEAARSLGQSPRQAFWRVTVPYLRPSIAAGSLLVALYVLRDFGAVSVFQFGTFTRVIYNRYQSFRLDEAAAMALLLVGLTGFILWLDHRSRGRGGYARLSAGCARSHPVARLGAWKWPALAAVALLVFLALVVPAGGLAYWLWRGLNQDWLVRDLSGVHTNVESFASLLRPAWNSVMASLLAAGLTVLLALPVTVLAVRKPGPFSLALERLTYVSAALPGIVVALAYVFIGVRVAQPLYQTLPMLLAGYIVLFLPQAIGSERSSLMQVSRSVEEAGRSLGQRPSQVFRRVTLPLLRPGLMAAGAMIFLTCMKELPATLILSPLGFETLAVEVWSNISEAFFARAAAPTLLLILLSSIPLALLTLRDGQHR
jgi:iron(III) transport system permease protein